MDTIRFGSNSSIECPDFLEVQLDSFFKFFKLGSTYEERKQESLYKVFQEHFPLSDSRNQFVLEFLDYNVDPPRYSIQECIHRGLTYSVPLRAKLKLYCTDEDHEDFENITQEVFLGAIPYMTPRGTFVINGAERGIVSQLHRSPGVFFSHSFHANGTKLYSARVIPFRGSWIEFTTDIHDVMYAYIDRKKKLPVTTLLRAIGFESDREILQLFNLSNEVKVTKKSLKESIGKKLAARILKTWIEDFVDEDTGEVVSIERNEVIIDRETIIEKEHIEQIIDAGVDTILLHHDETLNSNEYSIIYKTLQKDITNSEQEAIMHIYRQVRNAEPPDEEAARNLLEKLFFSNQKYSLGEVGRYKINRKLNLEIDLETDVLTNEDIICIITHLIELANAKANIDDIDHLSNRRVRTVGEQLYNQFGVGFSRMARTIRERMNVRDNEVFQPVDLINAKTLSSVINSFFGTSQLSQFLDQTNPLAEMTHKRRMSALGPGGLSRERAGFEVRDVHYTHYGRLCPIETPEGPNIGLISSLCVYAKVNSLGFIETPYRKVEKGILDISKKPTYLSAEDEDKKVIAQANARVKDKGQFMDKRVKARFEGDFPVVNPKEIDLMDVAPNQIASIAASLIPFLEHDDANRALMGSNMMRQAVPLLKAEAAIVGTGLEPIVAKDSRVLINAEYDGTVEYVDSELIKINYNLSKLESDLSFESNIKEYHLTKFQKTNQETCINLKPIVKKNQKVKKGQVLCEGFATQNGELALGRNLKVAFMPWKGYNFEDAIVLSERIAKEDLFTSIHIEEHIVNVRETKMGPEELTSDIPNVSEEATKNLDENGIIMVGAKINPHDILIGKITPKGEADPTPEEKLLKAIFGDKAGDVRDASLKAKSSDEGVIVEKKLYSRLIKDKIEKQKDKKVIKEIQKSEEESVQKLQEKLVDKMYLFLSGKVSQGICDLAGKEIFKKGNKYNKKSLLSIDFTKIDVLSSKWVNDDKMNNNIDILYGNFKLKLSELKSKIAREIYNINIGDELPSGILKLAKVYVAKKRKIKVGDKLAGRHGNKGIVAKIVREEDMPYLEDGTPVDIVLNPLGVPSRMNLGQVYESVLAWAGKRLNKKYYTPVFDGASLSHIESEMSDAGLPHLGKTYLYDGGTGEKFDQPTTVGIIYMLKLGHLIDDKMHSRSIGPYSLITQQPLGGKAQFGGQRMGEMEVWALEGYGAANILQEMLTLKSDDVKGRAKAYEAIVKGESLPAPNIPESFNVLLHELNGLCLKITFDN